MNHRKAEVFFLKQLKKSLIPGAVFVMAAGTMAHFVYEWSGRNPLVGLFTPVNESTWEHMKLLFFPMLAASYFISRKLKPLYPCISSALALGILLGTFMIPALFYTYTGILGFHLLVLDIFTFLLSVAFAFYVVLKVTPSCLTGPYASVLMNLLILLAACFLVFTVFPPDLGLFAVPGAVSP